MTDLELQEKMFAVEEFSELLHRAARYCYEAAADAYCVGPIPSNLLFYASDLDPRYDFDEVRNRKGVPLRCVKTFDEVVPLLRRDDGFFREWINLSPNGVDDEHTFIEVVWAEPWTDRLFVGEKAFPFEPFHILGPNLPPEWRHGDPIPRVVLPKIECLPDDYDWELSPETIRGLWDADDSARLQAAEALERRVLTGYGLQRVAVDLLVIARAERDSRVKERLMSIFLRSPSRPEFLEVAREWIRDAEPKVRSSAYALLSVHRWEGTFEVALAGLKEEPVERVQRTLLNVLTRLVGDSRERFEMIESVFHERPLPVTGQIKQLREKFKNSAQE